MQANAFGKVSLTMLAMSFMVCLIAVSITPQLVSKVQAQDGARRCNAVSIKGSYGYLNTGSAFGASLASVGSIIFDTSVILVAGKPLISACLRITASSLAR